MHKFLSCPICGADLENVCREHLKLIGGWVMCEEHRVFIKPSKFDSRCHACLGEIYEDDLIVMCKLAKWVILHPFNDCDIDIPQLYEPSSAYASLHLLDSAPWEVVVAAYKAMSLLYHPDRTGGDDEKMKEINNAVDEIRKQIK
jgi:hypothetical protein